MATDPEKSLAPKSALPLEKTNLTQMLESGLADFGNPELLLSLQFPMLYWALVCAIAALVFGLLGFTGLASGFATIARFLLAVFLILLLLILIFGGVSFHTGVR